MSHPEAELCPHCGAKMVEYRQRLNKVLVRGLVKAYKAGDRGTKAVHLVDVFPGGPGTNDYSEHCNFQKLRYFGLVVPSGDQGRWELTWKGRMFVQGRVWCYPIAVTYRGETVRFEGEAIAIDEVIHIIRLAPDWMDDAEPHNPEEDNPEGER